MGRVYKAYDKELNRTVAIKVVRQGAMGEADAPPIFADRTDVVPDPGALRVPRPHTRESATVDYLACSGLPAAVARRWSFPGE